MSKSLAKQVEVLFDGDLLVFSICAAVEYKHKERAAQEEWEDSDWLEFLPSILRSVDSKIVAIMDRLGGTKYTVYFSCSNPDNFRTTVMPEYKLNRKDVWRPNNLKVAIAETTRVHPSKSVIGLEADDLLAHYQKTDGSTVIVTLDKDLLQCRGAHYRWETPHEGEKFISVTGHGKLWMDIKCLKNKGGCGDTTHADRDNYIAASKSCQSCGTKLDSKNSKKEVKGNGALWFLYQCLIGDSTDGIMGCGTLTTETYKSGLKAGTKYEKRKGVGSTAAFELLNPYLRYDSALAVVKAQYVKQFGGKWVTELLKQGRCLYMAKNINPDGLIQMWHYDHKVVEFFDAKLQELVYLD
jgi:5'-3' exonuclease